MPQLLLIRHGETALNAARIVQPADTPLSPRGQAQARALATRLVQTPLAGILSSDLPRARQTADAIAATRDAAITTSALLHERNFGDLRGQPYDSLGFDPQDWTGKPPNGESQAEFEIRAQAAWRVVIDHASQIGGTIAVVTHGLVLRAWLERGSISLPSGMAPPQRMGNTSLTIAETLPPHRVSLLNCTSHLQGAASDDSRSLSGG